MAGLLNFTLKKIDYFLESINLNLCLINFDIKHLITAVDKVIKVFSKNLLNKMICTHAEMKVVVAYKC